MKPLYLTTVATLSLCLSSYSQSVDVTVHFPKGSARIENESLNALKTWASNHADFMDEKILLRGHTDRDAGDFYNLKLSERRNESVKKVLSSYGFETINFSSHGETWPLCQEEDESCMHDNRRVEVILLDSEEEKLHPRLGETSPQIEFFMNDEGNSFIGNGGVVFNIPQNSFVKSDGLPAENVRVEYREFLTIKDCIVNNLTTTSNGELLRTGGMACFHAYCGNEELSLAPGKEIKVLFPSQMKNPDSEMQEFEGIWSDGKVNWLPSASGSIKLERITKNSLEKDRRYLKKDGTYETEVLMGGRLVKVNWGEGMETVASFVTTNAAYEPLSSGQCSQIKDYIFGTWTSDGAASSSLSFSFTGWYNCDAFYKLQDPIQQVVEVNQIDDISNPTQNLNYILIIDGLNVLVSGRKVSDGTVVFSPLPSGKRATLIAYAEQGGKVYFGIKEMMTSIDRETLKISQKSDEEITKSLEKFDLKI